MAETYTEGWPKTMRVGKQEVQTKVVPLSDAERLREELDRWRENFWAEVSYSRRLREELEALQRTAETWRTLGNRCDAAEHEVERLRDALKRIVEFEVNGDYGDGWRLQEVARAALDREQ